MASLSNTSVPNGDFMNRPAKIDFLKSSVMHDRVIVVNEKRFYVQSGLLSLWSEHFHLLFNSGYKEANENEIKLEELDADDFGLFLKVIYPGRFEIKEDHLEKLITLAFRFLSPWVLDKCKEFIETNFAKLDKTLLLDMACLYDMEDIKANTMYYLQTNTELKSVNPIELLKCAFNHDLENVKNLLRRVIYNSVQWTQYYTCGDGCNKPYCMHVRGEPIMRNAFVRKYSKKIEALPNEIKEFIHKAVQENPNFKS